MAQHIYWEYHFALVCFDCHTDKQPNREEMVGGELKRTWCPQKDFENHLEKLAIPKKYFKSDDVQTFPDGFDKRCIHKFEQARIDLINYIRIEELGETWILRSCSECGAQGEGDFDWSEDKERHFCLSCGHPLEEGEWPEESFETFRISISVEKRNPPYRPPFDEGKGRRHSPTIESVGFDPLYLLYDWLFTVNPKGRYGTDRWVVLGHGVDSDDRVVTSIDTFHKHKGERVVARRNLLFDDYPEIDPGRGYALNKQMVHYYSPSAIRDMLKAWHPVLCAE